VELGGGSKKQVKDHMTFVLSKVFPLISLLFWCHMYDVLVYKMLWDQKKNIEYQFMENY
jgi:hypothetical protein